jgi:cytochrome b
MSFIQQEATKQVWTRFVRVLHWVVAICIVLNLFLLDPREDPHKILGYVAVAFVVMRVFYGFFSISAASFFTFPRSLGQIITYLKRDLNSTVEVDPSEGHNPLAWVIYVLVWLSILNLGLSGWMMGLDEYWGEEWLENWHEAAGISVQILVVLHFLGIVRDALKHRRHTWFAMISGKHTPWK